MKKSRNLKIGKRVMSSVIAMTMAMEFAPGMALAVNAEVSEKLVNSLTNLYDGDTERARQELEALYEAGIIDENGNMVELDIREDGEAVTLEDVTARITAGEEIGDLTVNGYASTQEQLVQIQSVKNALEIAKMLAEKVEVTDEHVENLENLIQGIADGSVDLDAAIESGTLSVNNMNAAPSISMESTVLAGDPEPEGDFPATKTGTGEVTADAEGNFTAPYISGADYDASHSFKLIDPENKTYFTDSNTEGIVLDGVITLSCADTAAAGGTVTVTATLNKAQSLPVSFDYAAAGGSIGASGSGTVTWEPGETGEKTFTVNVAAKGDDLWEGKRGFVINVSNVKNAVLPDSALTWSKTVSVSANDKSSMNLWTKVGEIIPDSKVAKQGVKKGASKTKGIATYYYQFEQKVNWMPTGLPTRFIIDYSGDVSQVSVHTSEISSGSATSNSSYIELALPDSKSGDPSGETSKRVDLTFNDDKTSAMMEVASADADFTTYMLNGETWLRARLDGKYKFTFSGSVGQQGGRVIDFVAGEYDDKIIYPTISKVTVEAIQLAKVTDVTVPAGTYYSGQTVPVTVTFDNYCTAREAAKLLVNNVECPILESDGTISKKFTFGYTVKDVDTGSINVTGIQNMDGFDTGTNFPQKSFGTDQSVKLISAVKQASLDIANAKYGISDETGAQTVTVLIPFKEGANVEWIGNESADCTTNGQGIAMSLPDYGETEIIDYLNGAYFSYDNGKTRYPVYVVRSTDGAETPLALACRFAAPANETAYLRKDTVNLFMDTLTVGISDSTQYLDTWANAKKDAQGFAYFDGTSKTDAAPIRVGAAWLSYILGCVAFEQDATTPRSTEEVDYTDKVENGWLSLDDGNYVLLNDPEHPEDQYDVEIVANDALYKAITGGARAEDGDDLTLSLQFSGRKTFTFTNANNFKWQSSDESIATITVDENGVAHVELTGKQGDVTFTLTVGNGSEDKAYTLAPVSMTVLEGKTPFLNIPKYSQIRQTLTGIDTDVAFSSNVTARNAQLGKDTVFTANVYRAAPVTGTDDQYNRTGDPFWTKSFTSTEADTLTHITVPGSQLAGKGAYAVVISTAYSGGKVGEIQTSAAELSETAYLIAKQAPASVSLNKLDSYYVTAGNIPAIGYTVSDSATEVAYTIQKSGEAVSEKIPVTGDVIPFTPTTPASLKEAYTITIYARNSAEDSWSVDSMLLTVYNPEILHQIVSDVTAGEIGGTTGGTGKNVKGKTVQMDNHDKMADYGVDEDGEYQLTFEDFTALRTDMSLQKIISVNYGEAVFGMLSDKMEWKSSDPKTVSVDYKQGGIYSDIRNYSYTSYAPATDFLMVGKKETGKGEKVTITATHANTGMQSSFKVTATTLKDQLYVFRFVPAVKTDVIYTNGKGEKRTLSTNDKGELAVYEPDGIFEPVMARSEYDGRTWVGTLYPDDLISGERDVASLQLYPCNNLRLRVISDATLTFLDPDGKPYTGEVTIRGGAYKNGVYCPGALLSVDNNVTKHNGREDIQATVTNGKLNITLDPTQFKHDPDSTEEYGGAQPGDTITYVFEYRFADTYQPGYVILNASTNIEGASSPTDSLVYMRNNTAGDTMPQIIHQNLQQYLDGDATFYTRNVIDFTNNIGVSKRLGKAVLTTDVALPGETVSQDDNGYTTYSSETVPHFGLFTPNNQAYTGQVDNAKTTADQIIDLSDLDTATLFVFPFSEVPVARSYYTMTDENLKKDGLTDEGTDPTFSNSVKAMFTQNGMTIKTETMPFGVSNLSHQRDLSTSNGGAKEVGDEVEGNLKSQLDMGSIFGDIDVNDLLKKGFVFMSKLSAAAGETPMHMMILPTEDPGTFRIVVSIGYNKREELETEGNPSINYDPEQIYDDMESFQKELEELEKDDKKDKKKDKKKDDDDDDDDDDDSVEINFYGTVILEANVGGLGNKWGVDFVSGTVGANFEAKYEWGQNLMVGPYPVTVSLEISGNADLEVSFANKAEARALLIDAVVGVSVEAFAGLGFDMSLVALKIGIFGTIGAEDNFLYLTTGNQTGNKLDISGEIGVKFVAKIALVKYEKTLASTGFNWTKKWGKYDQIQETWENEGYADMTGITKKGKLYTMRLMSNGTAMVTIDGGGVVENRDYLKRVQKWNAPKHLTTAADGMAMLQENAYPYSNPVLTDDGSIMLFISDNNNADELQSVVSYAVKNGDSYEIKGAVDTSENNILADTDVVASGTGDHAFAAWVKQMDSPKKEMHDSTTFDDLGMLLNATEIYGGSYVGGKWTVDRLTDNTNADMAPTIASSGNQAIVAWRSLNASSMPEEGKAQDITAMFNVENTINYRIFDGTEWKEAQIAYNGSAGTVNAIDSAMLSDGTSLLVYSVRTTDDVTGSETFYTLIDKEGNVITTGRLTNDNYTDTNAQVTTVGNQFVVGWYSEHEAGEEGDTKETVVSHDIGLARINANGSVDADFPQSIGGTAASKIGSDFHFSAPVGNTDLSKLSIVWSQKKESDKAEDANKQQLNAIRFFEQDGMIGVSAPTIIAETAKNYTIDSFDTYTDANDEVRAVLIGSDYSNTGNLNVYDTIDMTELPIDAVNDAGASQYLTILTNEPTASMKLASGTFDKSAIEVTADTNLRDLMPGLELPVQFTIRNTGTGKVNNVQAQIGSQSTEFKGLNLLPGQSAVVTANYAVPEIVCDVNYTLTADDSGKATGTLVLNRPDVGISGMKVVREGDKTRDIRLTLSNASNIPLTDSGKAVKLAFYKDMAHTEQIGETITIDPSAYQDIDGDIYTFIQTINVTDLIGSTQEIPDSGIRVYASTWVDNTDELYTMNNDANVTINGLLSKYKSQTTMDTALIAGDDGNYTVNADITNNSMLDADLGSITADILDANGAVLTTVDLTDKALTLTGEQNVKLYKALPELTGEPAAVSLRSSEKSVVLDAQSNFGTSDAASLALTADNKPAGLLPDAVREGYEFAGWFTKPTGGEKVTNDTVLEGGMTLYAQFNYEDVVDAEDADFQIKANGYEGTYDGKEHGISVSTPVEGAKVYFSDEKLDRAGFIKANQTASPKFADAGEHTVYYCITTPYYKTVIGSMTVNIAKAELTPEISITGWTYGDTANTPTVTGNTGNGAVTYTYYQGETALEKAPTDAGAYTVKATITATDNYKGAESKAAAFTIGKKSLTITADNAEKVYGTNDPALTYADVKLVGDDKLTGKLSRTEGENAGEYAITQGTLTAGDNYAITFVPGTFTITPADFSVDASGSTSIYDGKAHGISASAQIDGSKIYYLVSDEKPTKDDFIKADQTVSPSYTDAGVYKIWYCIFADNYTVISYQTVEITKAAIAPAAAIEGWTFGEDANAPSVTGNTGNGAVTYTYYQGDKALEKAPTNAGTYTVKATIAETANYKAAVASKEFTIAKAAITPAVTIKGWTFGETANAPTVTGNTGNGAVTYTYYQGDTALEKAPTHAGTYTVKAAIAETANYKAGEASTEFTIANAEFPVTAKGFEGAYDGKEHGISASTKVEGAKVYFSDKMLDEAGFVKANQTASPTFKNAGEHTVWYCITTPDYKTVIGSETVKIAQREITITADSLTSEYGADILPLTYKITGEIVTGDDLHIQLITNATKDAAGIYDITVYYQPDANYSVKVVNGVYTIKEAPETKATSATSETKATGATSETKATGGTTESKATGGTTESKATGGTTESKATGETTESKATGGTTESKATGETTESKATGGTTETKATGGTTEPKEPGGTNEPKESGETTEPHATETTSVTNETETPTNTFLPTDDTSFTTNPITTTTIMTDQTDSDEEKEEPKGGCYIATAVYGSYDCPEVWVLRRFRDNILAKTWYGRTFIRTYYAISPTLVKWFGKTDWFINLWKPYLDTMVTNLKDEGFEDTPYQD